MEEAQECAVSLQYRDVWQVVHFQSVSHVSKSTSFVLEFVGDEGDFVTAFYKTLGKLVPVRLYSSEFWKREVGTEQN